MNKVSITPVAAIDCGTNSTRLLVVAPDRTTLMRQMRITRLGQGVDATHRLSDEAMQRTLSVLSDYRHEMDDFGVERARVIATSAVRDAANGEEFLGTATEVVGVPVELLSGLQEGQLSYAGAASDLPPFDGDDFAIDIGGGSTEVVLARGDAIQTVSLDLGCVRITERCLLTDPPTAEEIGHALSAIGQQFDSALEAIPALADSGRRRLLGLAGTVSTVAMLDQGLQEYDRDLVHHHAVRVGAAKRWAETLIHEDSAASAHRGAISPGREDVIAGGALILHEFMRRFSFEKCLCSEADILDGLTASILD